MSKLLCVSFRMYSFYGRAYKRYFKTPNMYGMASLYGFIRPIFVVLRKVLSMELPLPLQVVEAVFLEDDGMTMLTPEIHYNSFVSIFYSMYLDGGLIGVFIGNLLLGLFARYSFLKLQKDNPYKLVAYTLIAIIFLLSFFKLLVCSYTYALSLYTYIYVFLRKRLYQIYNNYGRITNQTIGQEYCISLL